jgi:hypothetical protein
VRAWAAAGSEEAGECEVTTLQGSVQRTATSAGTRRAACRSTLLPPVRGNRPCCACTKSIRPSCTSR